MLNTMIGFLLLLIGALLFSFDNEIDYFFQMMENSAFILSLLAFLTGVMAIILPLLLPEISIPTKFEETKNKNNQKNLDTDLISELNEINRSKINHNEKPRDFQKNKKSVGRNKLKDIKGLIVDT